MNRIAETQRNHDNDDGAATNTATDAPQGVSAQERLRQYDQQRRRPTTTTVASRQEVRRTLFRAYLMVSIVLALLAILADDHQRVLSNQNGVVSSTMRYGVPVNKRRKRKRRRKDILWPSFGKKRTTRQQQRDKERHSSTASTQSEYYYGQQRDEQQQQQPGWVRWISRKFRQPFEPVMPLPPPAPWWLRWVDQSVLQSPSTSFLISLLIAKVTSSDWRLLVVSNLTILLVWLAQKHVARAFLGNNGTLTTDGGASTTAAATTTTTDSHKVDGYWVVQALMPLTVTAAVVPAEFILLWFISLLFCHFLHCKAGSSVVHTAHSGQTPVPGAFRLLLVVLVASALTLATLVRCFTGWYESDDDIAAMVWLFGTDWIVLATNSMKHLLHHSLQTLEHYQLSRVAGIQEAKSILEKRREEMEHSEQQDQQHNNEESVLVWDESDRSMFANDDDMKSPFIDDNNDEDCNDKDKTHDTGHLTTGSLQYCQPIRFPEPSQILDREYRMLDRRLETMESLHALRVGLLDSTMFGLELLTGVARIGHFVHIWYLHGFFAVDVAGGVLALHLHSHVSNILQKIGERANTNRIARDIDAMFKDATDRDIRESSSDCCCVCLGTMRSTRGVKKVSCGHMFHTHCLREIMERSKSVEAAKCPLCRAPVLSGPCQPPPRNLYRFTTAGVVPAWLPLFSDVSFVVMRNNHGNNDGEPLQGEDGPTAPREESSWRRLRTLFFGAATLSPQQEREALSQLVDMFPQYAREDLLRELRLRRSADGVVESILLGVFVGASTTRDHATTGPSNENNSDDGSQPASTTVPSVPATSTQGRSTRQADSIRTRVPTTHNNNNSTTIGASLVSNDDNNNNGHTTNGTPSPRPSFGSPPMIQRIVSPQDASDMMDQILGETPRTTPASVCTSLPIVDPSHLLSPGFDVSISRIVEEDEDDDCVDEDAPIENDDKREQIVVEDVLSDDDDDDVLYSPVQSVGKLHKTENDVSLSSNQDKTVVMEETEDANETNNDTNDRDKSLADDKQEEQDGNNNDEGDDNDDDSSDANDSTMFTVQRGQGETYQYIFPEADQTPIPPAPRRLFRTPRQG